MTKLTPRKCPKCRKYANSYTEIWSGNCIQFDTDDSGKPLEHGSLVGDSDPDHVLAHCNTCDHYWRLRGVRQITELEQANSATL